MIDKVLICGVRRARELVPVREIQQSVGRAGRSYEKSGEAVIICRPEDCGYAESCLHGETPPVRSELCSVESVAFQVLPWIDRVHDRESFDRWFGRSLAHVQGVSIRWEDVLGHLLEAGCVDEELNLTKFGEISVRLYYSPERLGVMLEKLQEAAANGNALDPITLSYVLSSGHVPLANADGWELSEYKSSVMSNGYSFEHGELIEGFAYHCILTGRIPKWVKHVTVPLKQDLGRAFTALSMLASMSGLTELSKGIRVASVAADKRVPVEVASILVDFGLERKSSAYELMDLGIVEKADLRASMGFVIDHATEGLKQDLMRHGLLPDLLAEEMRQANAQ